VRAFLQTCCETAPSQTITFVRLLAPYHVPLIKEDARDCRRTAGHHLYPEVKTESGIARKEKRPFLSLFIDFQT
jgi:hypothetical protein